MDNLSIGFTKEFEHSQQLFDAALDEFIERGYENASLNVILTKAEMSKGQFYYHFGNKEGLYLALIAVVIEKKQEFLASIMKPDDWQRDIFGILRTQVQYGLAFANQYPVINRFAESFTRETGNAIYTKALSLYNFDDNGMIDQLVEMAHQRGEFREDVPLWFIRQIIGYLFTNSIEVAGLSEQGSFEERLNYLIEVMRFGITHRE